MNDSGEHDDKKGGFVIRDKRRFDSDGNERAEGAPSQSAAKQSKTRSSKEKPAPAAAVAPTGRPAPAAGPAPAAAQPATQAAQQFTMEPAAEEGDEGVDFASFAMSLATQALMQLGEMRPPPGMDLPIDRDAAKQTIDILSMLHRKTKGNLSAVETKLMEDILHNLRMSYLRKV